MSQQNLIQRSASHPVFICAFRPFFILTAGSAVLLMALWLSTLTGLVHWPVLGSTVLWHAHELLFGFVAASIAGFVLTAVPEFTHTAGVGRIALLRIVLLWLLSRGLYAVSGLLPPSLILPLLMLSSAAFWLAILWEVSPRTWQQPERKHISFIGALLLLAALQQGFFISLWLEKAALPWLYLTVGALMALIILAASRVSMAVVNGLIEQGRPGVNPNPEVGYLARPPRRNLAIFAIALCSAVEFLLGHNFVTGWTALAAATAMLNLLNDWHVGKALFTRWALLLYGCYWLMALGYLLMGLGWLGIPIQISAGRHVLMIGAMGMSVFTIMVMVGRIHSGLWLDRRMWIPMAVLLLVLATVARLLAGTTIMPSMTIKLWLLAGLLWISVFALYLFQTWNTLTRERSDGQAGCAEPIKEV